MRLKYHARCRRLRSSFTRVHVLPPSSDRNRPPSSASICAHTRSGLAPDTVTDTFPISPLGKPGLRVSSSHVSPPSVDLNSPLPAPPLSRSHGLRYTSQKPAYKMFEFVGSNVRSIAPAFGPREKTF